MKFNSIGSSTHIDINSTVTGLPVARPLNEFQQEMSRLSGLRFWLDPDNKVVSGSGLFHDRKTGGRLSANGTVSVVNDSGFSGVDLNSTGYIVPDDDYFMGESYTVIMVAKQKSTNISRLVGDAGTSSASSGRLQFAAYVTGGENTLHLDHGGVEAEVIGVTMDDSQYHVMAGAYDAASGSLSVSLDGGEWVTTSGVGSYSGNNILIGSMFGQASADTVLRDVMIFDVGLNVGAYGDSVFKHVVSLLKDRYGL